MTFKFRLSDLNLMIGMGWAKPDNAFIKFSFSYSEADGPTVNVSIKNWEMDFPLDDIWLDPSNEWAFWLGDWRKLINQIEPHYANFHAMLTFKIEDRCWEVVGGPGNGIQLKSM